MGILSNQTGFSVYLHLQNHTMQQKFMLWLPFVPNYCLLLKAHSGTPQSDAGTTGSK